MIRVFTCNHCSRIHLEIGHTQIHFRSIDALEQYLGTLDAVDTEYYAAVNSGKGLTKVIILPLSDSGAAHLGFTVEEFQELKEAIRSYLSGQSTERFGIRLGVFQALPSGRGFLQSPGVYGRR